MDYLQPFSTFFAENPDYSVADALAETERLIQRQTVIDQVLRGKRHPDDALDCLSDQGLNPDVYIEAVDWVVNQIITEGIMIEDTDWLTYPSLIT